MVKNDGSSDWPEVDQPFETEDEDLCPLCMEELDISDLKLSALSMWLSSSAGIISRKISTEDVPAVVRNMMIAWSSFKPMKPEELKRLQQAKKQREKERKDQELVNRKHLANVRVKQKNQVHVQGLTTKVANEDVSYPGSVKNKRSVSQYGRIQKMFMSRRTGSTSLFTPDARYQHVNLYINFSRNNEALACIHGVDGLTLPDGHRLKATLGSTKYCASFLRGLKCTNDNCTGAHELAEEVEGGGTAAREEMSTARHAQKESESRYPSRANLHHPTHASTSNSAHPNSSGVALPATASWATKSASISQPASPAPAPAHPLALHPGTPNGNSVSRPFSKPPGIPLSKSTHPLPPKPRPSSSSEDVNPRPVDPSGHMTLNKNSEATTANSNQGKPSSQVPQSIATQQKEQILERVSSDPSASIPSGSGPSTSNVASQTPSNNVMSSSSHPPGLLPPGLTPQAMDHANRSTPSLPPGLTLPSNSTNDSSSNSWQNSFDPLGSLDLKRAEKSWVDPLSDDLANVLSTFSPNFGDSRLSIFANSNDGPFDSSRSFGPSGYSGTFNPFADTDFPSTKDEGSLFGIQADTSTPRAESSLNDRRGSRFGFARRDSSGSVFVPPGMASSPLRSIFSHQNNEPESPKALHNQLQRLGRAAPMGSTRPQDLATHLGNNPAGDSTPDASVTVPRCQPCGLVLRKRASGGYC
ncbi:transcriptional repressor proteinral negative regulator of transcription subunit 4 [Puccinia graminis f. sp. tritici]|uniref:Transcriptional repressor proteinral negative regulator of transcription subunit 4 n=1 Tax=Puccinia graminis f. sp. tritici TaxID=56615 RepID=A0A5B0QWM5_PUCGR|nr:transcriptional repressor proteinral negative regulator of transcription subunit 4 [Puccinia graminis f. sp. tritici]